MSHFFNANLANIEWQAQFLIQSSLAKSIREINRCTRSSRAMSLTFLNISCTLVRLRMHRQIIYRCLDIHNSTKSKLQRRLRNGME